MGDVITRFKLETTQYDSALRDASTKLSTLTRHLSLAGKDFDKFAKEQVAVAKAFGNTASGATNLKDKLRDLVGAYNQVAKSYNSLTKEQQQTDFGKAMAESLQTLKTRITQTKTELYSFGDSTKSTGGILSTLKEKFTINIDALKLFKIGLNAAKGALDVAKEAFFKNEQNLDEWGRTVKASESLYTGFLNALNSGSVNGYLNNIDDIVQAAREAYNALDELSTFNAFNQVNRTKNQASFQEAINNYRADPSLQNRVMLNAKFSTYRGNLTNRQQLEEAAYKAEVARVAAERGVSAKDLQDALSGSWGNYRSLKALPMTGTAYKSVGGGNFGYSQSTEYAVPANEAERLGEALRQLNDTELQYLQSLGAAANSTTIEITSLEKQMLRATRAGNSGGGSGGSGGSGGRSGVGKGDASALLPQYSVAGLAEDLKYLQQEQQKATSPEEWRTYADAIRAVDDEIKKVKGELSSLGTDNTTGGISISGILSAQIQKDEAALRNKKINVTIPAEKEKVDTTQKVGELVGSVSSIVNSLNQLGVEIPKGFSNVLSGMQVVITILEAIQTIQTVGSILGIFHNGGIVPHAASGYMVPGTHYSNDVTPVLANAGELILSKSQQGNLAAMLSDTQSGYSVQPYVNAETIVLGVNNHFQRSGQGEIVTTKMLKSMGLIN